MLDIKWVRENPENLDKMLISRGAEGVSSRLLSMDESRRKIQTELQGLQSQRNDVSKKVGEAKAKGEDAAPLFEQMKSIGPKVKELEEKEREVMAEFEGFIATLPNILHDSVPEGKDESENVEVHKWGTPREFSFEPKPHYEVGENLGFMNFDVAGKISGSRFAWVCGDLARLERALGCFMVDEHVKNGFMEVLPPLLVNPDSMYGTGQYPKFEEDAFITNDDRNLALAPTSEVSMTNYVRGEILSEEQLPMRFTAFCPNFRKEAGSAGKDTRGYIRMHQFNKVEMVQIVHPEKSWDALEFMRGRAQDILEKLELPYRTVALCTGDVGFGASKTYDLEVWLPTQNTYREISSCSNCTDFQARRMKARFKDVNGKIHFVHTLNGTGVAVGRALVAILENNQQEDGSVAVPEVLRPYMGGQELIEPLAKKGQECVA